MATKFVVRLHHWPPPWTTKMERKRRKKWIKLLRPRAMRTPSFTGSGPELLCPDLWPVSHLQSLFILTAAPPIVTEVSLYLMVCAAAERRTTEHRMHLIPVWVSMLLGLLVGFLPAVGTEPGGGAKPSSGHAPSPESPSCGSNCSHLTVKLEFSSKVVEHGENILLV